MHCNPGAASTKLGLPPEAIAQLAEDSLGLPTGFFFGDEDIPSFSTMEASTRNLRVVVDQCCESL